MSSRLWQKVENLVLPDDAVSWDRLISTGPLFLIFGASSILLKVAPFYGVTLLFASFVHLTFLRKHPFFSKSILTAFLLFSLYCLKGQPRDQLSFNAIWIFSLYLSSLLSYNLQGQVRVKQGELETERDAASRDLDLWQSRFHTIKEKLQEDREVLEGEIEAMRLEKEQALEHLESIKKLSAVAHHRAQQLEEMLSKEKQEPQVDPSLLQEVENLKRELEETKKELQIKEEVIQQRQMRNQTLLAKRPMQPSISLKEIAKKI